MRDLARDLETESIKVLPGLTLAPPYRAPGSRAASSRSNYSTKDPGSWRVPPSLTLWRALWRIGPRRSLGEVGTHALYKTCTVSRPSHRV